MTRTHIPLDELGAMATAIPIKPLPITSDVSALYPCLYDFGMALMLDAEGRITRVVSDVTLDADNNPCLVEGELVLLPENATLKEVRRLFELGMQRFIPLVDSHGVYTGYCASKQALSKLLNGQIEMPRIGGLATPLGVYLTTGVYTAGAGTYGLILTGVSFALFVMAARFGFYGLSIYYAGIRELNDMVQMGIIFGILLLLIKFSPLSGLHAAEHQTIHAIEEGLPLTPENVRAQPKCHQRCGTNMMVGMVGVGMGILGANIIQPLELAIVFLVVWLVLLIIGWKQLGILLQEAFTTTTPTRWQIDNAVDAGKKLIERYRMRPHGSPTMWQRVWGSGMIQILFAYLFTSWTVQQIIDIWTH